MADSTIADASLAATGARVLALTGAVGALLAMCLPWAATIDGRVEWSGWGMYEASRVYLLLAAGTIAVLAGAWLAFERRRWRWVPGAAALTAAALLVASFPIISEVPGTTAQYGVVAWRLSILLVVLGAFRLSVLFEEWTRR